MTTGEKIKTLRTGKGWSQDELAKKLGYTSRSTVNKIELGINDITQSTLKKIAEVFSIDPCELIVETPLDMEAMYRKWDSELPDQEILKVKIFDRVAEVFGKDASELLHLFSLLSVKDRPKALEYISLLSNRKDDNY